jgi:hypothetical protein
VRKEDWEFQASLVCIGKLCLKNKQKKRLREMLHQGHGILTTLLGSLVALSPDRWGRKGPVSDS